MGWKTLTLGGSWLRWSKHNDDDNDDDDDDDSDDDDDDDDDRNEEAFSRGGYQGEWCRSSYNHFLHLMPA